MALNTRINQGEKLDLASFNHSYLNFAPQEQENRMYAARVNPGKSIIARQ